MKKFTKQAIAIVAIAAFAVAGCKKSNDGNFDRSTGAGGPFPGADSVITGNITANRTLSPGKVYKLNGVVYVTGGAKLTIKPGTIITTGEKVNYKVDPSTSVVNSIAGVLVITRGSKIDAVGTPSNPIVFTTPKAKGSRAAGDFGGVIILGNSTTNKPSTTVIEGLPGYDANGVSLGVDLTYGGNVPADNSGKLQYVRIEYAGYLLAPNNEINGLTMGGVGSGTTIDHVQVSFGADDAFEFFGGTVSPKYLIALGNDDDDFDTDFGYSGTIQYAISLKDPQSTHSTSGGVSDSNGIESDNDGTGSTASPRTKPTYSNFTLLGYSSANTGLRAGNRWRRNSDLSITNSIIAGYNTGAEFQSGTETNATAGGFTNNIVHSYTTVFSPATAVSLTGSVNSTLASASADAFIGLGTDGEANLSPFYTTDLRATYSLLNLYPRDAASTKGAVLESNYSDWNSGWANFAPQD
ncbi:hypothetical protein TH53_10840 [Pedobacter lusitanus]|uniref:T9SS C-terminal target domain-containing protein n=1 Tax=Pedobacter lusitanus TaxID=1503925 RepID=A0A0D0F670_9SPHI|nr:hypothetical protein [Pedobacter lusitanus]KIO77133.1 hypothetical protein TH53_10840 [Pedobacter lusitanus]